jgi:hypothetical protein
MPLNRLTRLKLSLSKNIDKKSPAYLSPVISFILSPARPSLSLSRSRTPSLSQAKKTESLIYSPPISHSSFYLMPPVASPISKCSQFLKPPLTTNPLHLLWSFLFFNLFRSFLHKIVITRSRNWRFYCLHVTRCFSGAFPF